MRWQSLVAGLLIAAVAFFIGTAWSEKATSAQENQEQMEPPEWTKLTAQHKEMQESVGEYDVKGEMWMAPGAPPQEFNGTATRKMIMGGRFIQEDFKSMWMGEPFEGRLIQSYDTIDNEYVNVWFDNMSPRISVSRGKEKGGTLVFKGREPDFMTGVLKNTKSVVDPRDDQLMMAMYEVHEDGTEHMTMKFHYTKKGMKKKEKKEKKEEGGW